RWHSAVTVSRIGAISRKAVLAPALADRDRSRNYRQRGSASLLRRRRMVVLQETAQTLTADEAVAPSRLSAKREKQHVAQALMVPLLVIMRHELANCSSY